ncbi:MAG TPA: MerR family transcriptional regulator, partial [Nitrospiria bacterium]
MADNDKRKPLFMIGVAADLLGLHPQTLRLYERLGFVVPRRTKGKTRMYSQQNIEQVRTVITLT